MNLGSISALDWPKIIVKAAIGGLVAGVSFIIANGGTSLDTILAPAIITGAILNVALTFFKTIDENVPAGPDGNFKSKPFLHGIRKHL